MTLESEISSLKTLVNSLLSRVSQLENENSNLRQENILLHQENLKTKLEKNSSNSHKPPSSDGYAKKSAGWHSAIPKTTDKAVDGQEGNVGKTLQMISKPDLIVKHYLQKFPNCLGNLSESDVIKVGSCYQSFDLPVQKLFITEKFS